MPRCRLIERRRPEVRRHPARRLVTLKKSQRGHVASDTESEIHGAAAAQARFLIGQIDFHVVMTEELVIQRKDGLIDGLFRDEEKPAGARIGGKRCALARGNNELEEFGRKSFGRLNINPDASQVFARSNGGNSDAGIMGERAQDAFWPNWRPRRRFGQGCPLMAQLFDQRARNNARRSAGPSYLDRAAAERTSFFREQRMLVARADQPVINQNAWWC